MIRLVQRIDQALLYRTVLRVIQRIDSDGILKDPSEILANLRRGEGDDSKTALIHGDVLGVKFAALAAVLHPHLLLFGGHLDGLVFAS